MIALSPQLGEPTSTVSGTEDDRLLGLTGLVWEVQLVGVKQAPTFLHTHSPYLHVKICENNVKLALSNKMKTDGKKA